MTHLQIKRNNAITLSRVTGMMLIILCHIISFYPFIPGHESLNHFFNCGVQLFIYISGYLYGLRTINGYKSFFKKRMLSVSFPAIIVSIITIIALLIVGVSVSVPSIFAYCFDLEGLLFLNWSVIGSLFNEITSLGPLWFTTVIMLCYLLLPLLQKIYNLKVIKNNFKIFLLIFVLAGLVLCIVLRFYIDISYFLWFAIGFFTGRIKLLNKIKLSHLVLYSIAFIIVIILRLLLHRYYDGTNIYIIYSGLSHFVLGTWFVVLYSYLNNRFDKAINTIANSKIIRWLDAYSYYIYLVHGIFCAGVFNIFDYMPLYLSSIVFLIVTVLCSIIIKIISDFIQNGIKNKLQI